jgi:cell wall-associated NlpC family hydrolase
MPLKRLTGTAVVLLLGVIAGAQVQASDIAVPATANILAYAASPSSPALDPVSALVRSVVPSYADVHGTPVASEDTNSPAADSPQAVAATPPAQPGAAESITDLRKSLIAVAMQLRDIRYVYGGHNPATGFDCSGFVRYVFAHAIGMRLPTNSASQFLAGLRVKRADMKPGDLVFFHTHGKRRISHVGIYISDGRFIHSPSKGKSVQISSLDEAYWARHFAGAKRPEAIVQAAHNG